MVSVPPLVIIGLTVVANLVILVLEAAHPKWVTEWHLAVGMPLTWRPWFVVARMLATAGVLVGVWLPWIGFLSAAALTAIWSLWGTRHRLSHAYANLWVVVLVAAPGMLATFIFLWQATTT